MKQTVCIDNKKQDLIPDSRVNAPISSPGMIQPNVPTKSSSEKRQNSKSSDAQKWEITILFLDLQFYFTDLIYIFWKFPFAVHAMFDFPGWIQFFSSLCFSWAASDYILTYQSVSDVWASRNFGRQKGAWILGTDFLPGVTKSLCLAAFVCWTNWMPGKNVIGWCTRKLDDVLRASGFVPTVQRSGECQSSTSHVTFSTICLSISRHFSLLSYSRSLSSLFFFLSILCLTGQPRASHPPKGTPTITKSFEAKVKHWTMPS